MMAMKRKSKSNSNSNKDDMHFSDHARLDVAHMQSLTPDRRDLLTKKNSGYSRISMPAMKLKSSINEFKASNSKSMRRKSMNDGIAVLDTILVREQTAQRPSLQPAQIKTLVTLRNSLEKVEEIETTPSTTPPRPQLEGTKTKSMIQRAYVSDTFDGLFSDSDDEKSTDSEELDLELSKRSTNSPQSSLEFDLMQLPSSFKYGKKPETGVNVLFAFGAVPLPSPQATRKQLRNNMMSSRRVSSSVLHQNGNSRSNLRLQKLASRRASSLLAKKQSHAPKEWYEIDLKTKIKLAELLSWDNLCQWDKFDVFEIDQLTGGNALLFVGWAILSSPYSQHVMEEVLLERNQRRPVPFDLMDGYRFIDHFHIDQKKMTNFLRSIQKDYFHENPYHNSIHAADVLQTLHSLLQQMGGAKKLQPTPMHLFSTLLSVVIHDVGHPGYNNFFQQSSQSDIALCYNDQSCLENMHLALAFRKLLGGKKKPSINIFGGMKREQVMTCRKLMIGAVLGTDMSKHFQSVNDVKKRIAELNAANGGSSSHRSPHGVGPAATADEETTIELLHYLMHVADISNGAKPKPIAVKWADRCLEEFFRQGDKEKEMGLPVSPLCDRDTVSRPESQKGFIEFIIQPTFEVLVGIMPSVEHKILPILKTNLAFWNSQIPQKLIDGMEQLHDDFQKNDGVLADDETASMAPKDRCSGSLSSLDLEEDVLQEEVSEELRREEASEELVVPSQSQQSSAEFRREQLLKSAELNDTNGDGGGVMKEEEQLHHDEAIVEKELPKLQEEEEEEEESEKEEPSLLVPRNGDPLPPPPQGDDSSSRLSFGSMSFASDDNVQIVPEKAIENGDDESNSDWSSDLSVYDYDSEMEYEC